MCVCSSTLWIFSEQPLNPWVCSKVLWAYSERNQIYSELFLSQTTLKHICSMLQFIQYIVWLYENIILVCVPRVGLHYERTWKMLEYIQSMAEYTQSILRVFLMHNRMFSAKVCQSILWAYSEYTIVYSILRTIFRACRCMLSAYPISAHSESIL